MLSGADRGTLAETLWADRAGYGRIRYAAKLMFSQVRANLAVAILLLGAPALLRAAENVDRILIEKSDRRITLLSNDRVVRSFAVSLGGQPVGHKTREGDEKTPEGDYEIDARNAQSSFYRSIRISYPNDNDRARARILGVDPGGLIMIHGMRNGFGWIGRFHLWLDWTDGCVAVTNDEMDEIWQLVELGTPVRIVP